MRRREGGRDDFRKPLLGHAWLDETVHHISREGEKYNWEIIFPEWDKSPVPRGYCGCAVDGLLRLLPAPWLCTTCCLASLADESPLKKKTNWDEDKSSLLADMVELDTFRTVLLDAAP